MNTQELNILETFDASVRLEPNSAIIYSIAARVEQKLIRDPGAWLAGEPVPLDIYERILPHGICSSWVFAVRAPINTGAERHPNSQQRMMSYRGAGDLQVWDGNKWRSHYLVSDLSLQVKNRWISIPPNTWHQAVVTEENWIVVSFHTVSEDELTEERPDTTDINLTHQRRYLDGQ